MKGILCFCLSRFPLWVVLCSVTSLCCFAQTPPPDATLEQQLQSLHRAILQFRTEYTRYPARLEQLTESGNPRQIKFAEGLMVSDPASKQAMTVGYLGEQWATRNPRDDEPMLYTPFLINGGHEAITTGGQLIALSDAELRQLQIEGPKAAALNLASPQEPKPLNDATLWQWSREAKTVAKGKEIYTHTCAACHGVKLDGKKGSATLAGEPLHDTVWKYGGAPTQILDLATNGSPDMTKGMPCWQAIIGHQDTAAAVAYVLSHHREGEPVRLTKDSPLHLIGAWRGGQQLIEFHADGTFVLDPGIVPEPKSGHWTLEGNRLTQLFSEGKPRILKIDTMGEQEVRGTDAATGQEFTFTREHVTPK